MKVCNPSRTYVSIVQTSFSLLLTSKSKARKSSLISVRDSEWSFKECEEYKVSLELIVILMARSFCFYYFVFEILLVVLLPFKNKTQILQQSNSNFFKQRVPHIILQLMNDFTSFSNNDLIFFPLSFSSCSSSSPPSPDLNWFISFSPFIFNLSSN